MELQAVMMSGLCVAGGVVALVLGGELLVRGAASLALAARISPLVVGLTVVAFGTSSPELAVSVDAALAGKTDIGIGNVIGSNIANILLILGLCALASPLELSSQLVKFDVPLMVLASLMMWGMSWDAAIGRGEGLLLFLCVGWYTVWLIRKSRSERRDVVEEFAEPFPVTRQATGSSARHGLRHLVSIGGGLALLCWGAHLLVDGGAQLARWCGVSELVIGLTIVAVGTSLPELMTSLVASVRGQRDLAVGNIVGSNLFNIWCVIGLSATVAPRPLHVSPQALAFDLPVMIVVAAACLPIFWTGQRINRWEGALFLLAYLVYLWLLVRTG